MQQAAHVIRMIRDAEPGLDQFRNARRGPEIGRIACCEWPSEKRLHEPALLRRGQFGRPPRRRLYREALRPVRGHGIPPALHGAGRAPKAARHIMQREIPVRLQ